MFRTLLCPSSEAFHHCTCSLWLPCDFVLVASSSTVLLISTVFAAQLQTHPHRLLYGNRRLRLQFKSAPDDGQNVARNMLSSVYTIKDFTTECACGWLFYLKIHQMVFLMDTHSVLCEAQSEYFIKLYIHFSLQRT
jgi:hypothetical protein